MGWFIGLFVFIGISALATKLMREAGCVTLILAGIGYAFVLWCCALLGALSGAVCGALLGVLTVAQDPAAGAGFMELAAISGAFFGYAFGSVIGFSQSYFIIKRKLRREPLGLQTVCAKVALFACGFTAVAICLVYPEATLSLVSVALIVCLAGALVRALENRTKHGARSLATETANTAAWLRMSNLFAEGRWRMQRLNWVVAGLAALMLIAIRIEPPLPLAGSEAPARYIPAAVAGARNANTSALNAEPHALRSNSTTETAAAREAAAKAEVYIVRTRNNAMASVRACASTDCALMGRAMPGDRIKAVWIERGESVFGSREWIAFEDEDAIVYIHGSLLERSE